jgi:hypothetical protein
MDGQGPIMNRMSSALSGSPTEIQPMPVQDAIAVGSQSYRGFGLTVDSVIELPALLKSNGPPDVVVRYGRLERPWPETPVPHPLVGWSPESALFFWDTVGYVLIEGGTRITIDPLPGASAAATRQVVQGVAMGTLLHQRGLPALHASAVAIDGRIVAFLGRKHAGKSTTAAALQARGHELVTDDVLVLCMKGTPPLPYGFTGTRELKLAPEAASTAFGEDPESLMEAFEGAGKRIRPAGEYGGDDSFPVGAIYLLEYFESTTQSFAIEPVSPRDGCLLLVQHSYAQRMIGRQAYDGEHLRQSALLGAAIPLRSIRRRRSLEELSDFAEAIELDFLSLTAGMEKESCNRPIRSSVST